MPYRPELSVLVVTHNKPELVTQFILSIAVAKDTPKDTEVLVYQSGNPLGHAAGYLKSLIQAALASYHIASAFFRVIVIEDPMNLGVSVGFNTMIPLARGKYLFLSNDDMIMNASGWYKPLVAALEEPSQRRGLVCSQIINDKRNFSLAPTFGEMGKQIKAFSDAFASDPLQSPTFVASESNQPWLVRKEDIVHFDAQDPIENQRKWICEWADPSGAAWACDWCAYHKVVLAGYLVGMVPQSITFHYDHVTVAAKDKHEPGWTSVPMERYAQKWGTIDKHLLLGAPKKRFKLVGETLELLGTR